MTPWSVTFAGDAALVSDRDTGNILELTGGTTRVIGTLTDVVQQGRVRAPQQSRSVTSSAYA